MRKFNFKRVMALVLSVVLLLCVMPITAMAAEPVVLEIPQLPLPTLYGAPITGIGLNTAKTATTGEGEIGSVDLTNRLSTDSNGNSVLLATNITANQDLRYDYEGDCAFAYVYIVYTDGTYAYRYQYSKVSAESSAPNTIKPEVETGPNYVFSNQPFALVSVKKLTLEQMSGSGIQNEDLGSGSITVSQGEEFGTAKFGQTVLVKANDEVKVTITPASGSHLSAWELGDDHSENQKITDSKVLTYTASADATCKALLLKSSKVLLWSTDLSAQNDSNNKNNWGYNSYDSAAQMFSLAVLGITVDKKAGEAMPSDLSEYSLVWLHLPAITVDNYSSVVNVTALKNYLNKGGRVVILAETGSMMAQQGFDYNAGISALVATLGGNVTIASEDNTDSGWTTGINSDSKLMEGVDPSEFGEETYLVFPALTLTGNAQWVAKRSSASASGVFMAEQAAGKGRLTVFSDFNWYTKNTPAQGGANTDNASILRFFKNLVTDTKANMATVAEGGNPNADFGVVTVSTAEQLTKALADAMPGVHTTIKLTDNILSSGSGGSSADAMYVVAAGKNITIDLNGKNIEHTDNASYAVAAIRNNGTLTVINSSNTPAAVKGNDKGINNAGTMTVKGDSVGDISLIGEANQGLEVGPNSKTNISGATITGAYAGICDQSGVDTPAQVYIENAHIARVANGTLDSSYAISGYNNISGGVYTFGGGVTMSNNGGKLINLDDNDNRVYLSSGTLSYQDKGNGVYAIVQNPSVKNIDELTEAIKNAADGAVIKLEGDIEGHIEIPAGKNVVLDLNGHKIECNETNPGRPVTNRGTLKVTDSSEEQTGALTGAKHAIWNYGILTVEAGTLTGTGNEAIINDQTATSVTVTGGTLRGGFAAICDYDADGTVVLSNCVLEGLDGNWVITSYGSDKGGTYTINPGVVLKNEKKPTQLINTDNGVATNNKQVAVANWDEIVIENGTVKVNTAPILSDLEKAYNTAKGNIKAIEGLTDAQRTALLDKLDKEYAAAKKAVSEAKTYADAVTVADKFATDIQLIVEKGKAAAEIAAAAKEEIKKIENANNLSNTKKAAWKAQVNKAYADAFDALLDAESGDIDDIKSNALETLEDYGSTVANEDIIQLVNDKAAAADSLRKNAEDAKRAIDAMSNLSAARKTELKNAIDEAAEAAEAAIMATNSSADAKKALDNGIDAITEIKATAEKEDVKLPQTGDNSHIYLWMSIMLISLAALVLLYKKKALLSE